ncbi:hypothetical protein OG216_32970 [Streptomycetaceae bacterium NBC_01309]
MTEALTRPLAQPLSPLAPLAQPLVQPVVPAQPQPQAQSQTRPQHPTQVRPPARPVGRPASRRTTQAAVRPAGAAPPKGAARSRGTSAAAELDDELALAATTGQCLVAVSRALRMALRAVESWRADPGRAGCLCRAAEEIRVAIALIEGVTPPRLRRGAVWTGPVEEVLLYPVSTVARLLGRTVRAMRGLAQGGAVASGPGQGTAAVTLDATARTQCRTAWEHAFHALIRLRAVQEAATWFPDSPVDPWLLLAAEAPVRLDCPQCDRLRRRRRRTTSGPGTGDGTSGAKIIPFPQRPGPVPPGTNHVC